VRVAARVKRNGSQAEPLEPLDNRSASLLEHERMSLGLIAHVKEMRGTSLTLDLEERALVVRDGLGRTRATTEGTRLRAVVEGGDRIREYLLPRRN
jgi:hypothetical protein